MVKNANKSKKNWLKKWGMYLFIVISISVLFGLSLLVTILSSIGVITIQHPAVWYLLTIILGVLILIFALIILGYLLLMVKPK